MEVTEAQAILQTFIHDDMQTLYDKVVGAKLPGMSPGMVLVAICLGVIFSREGDVELEKIIEGLQQMLKDGKGSDTLRTQGQVKNDRS